MRAPPVLVLLAALLGAPAVARGQWLDPDTRILAADKYQHFAAGAALNVAVRGPWIAASWRDTPWKRIGLVCAGAAFYEATQVVAEHWNGRLGSSGYGFGILDLVWTCAGGAVLELVW